MEASRLSNKNSTKVVKVNSIIDDLTCSVCLDYYSDPRILTCHHTFCRKCITPLVKDRFISCPKCRKLTQCLSMSQMPKNHLVNSLIESISTYKASCPECKKMNDLLVCDHCSQIFCDSCLKNHFENSLVKLSNRLDSIEMIPKLVNNLKTKINECEQKSLVDAAAKMDELQEQILNLFRVKKVNILASIKEQYRVDRNRVEVADFRVRLMTKEVEALCAKKKEIAEKYQQEAARNDDEFVKRLRAFESECEKIHQRLKDAVGNLEKENNQIHLNYQKIRMTEMLEKLNEIMSLEIVKCDKMIVDSSETKANKQEDENEDEDLIDEKNEITIRDYFGRSQTVRLSSNIESIENLKNKLRVLLGWDSECIDLINAANNETLANRAEIVFRKGRVYLVKPEDREKKEKDELGNELDIFVTYNPTSKQSINK